MNGKVTSIDAKIRKHEVRENQSVGAVLYELKDEASQFVQTRVSLLKSELSDKLPNLKAAAIFAVAGALLAVTAYLLLTAALVTLIAALIKNTEFRWVIALAGVGVVWAILGGATLFMARSEFAQKGILPKRTLAVLKGDKIWLQREVKNQG
jgi:uncharacterized membrane protein YqjE